MASARMVSVTMLILCCDDGCDDSGLDREICVGNRYDVDSYPQK